MFLNNLFNSKEINNIDLAYELLNFNINGKYTKKVRQILKEYTKKGEEYPDKQDIFLKAVDLIGEPNTPKEKYIVAEAYLCSRYPFKLKGIEYGKKYIESELWKEHYESLVVPKNVIDTLENRKNIEVSYFLNLIGKVYESENMLTNALECYDKEIQYTPFFSSSYIDKAKILVKLDKKEEALELLKSTRESKYYLPYSTKIYEWQTEQIDSGFKESIERCIQDIENKIKKNYQYKSRQSKCILEEEYYNNLSQLQKEYLKEYINKGLVIIK